MNFDDQDKEVNDIVDKLMSYHPAWKKVNSYFNNKVNNVSNLCSEQIGDLINTVSTTDYMSMANKVNNLSGFVDCVSSGSSGIMNGTLNNNFSEVAAMFAGGGYAGAKKLFSGGKSNMYNDYDKMYKMAKKSWDNEFEMNKQRYPEAYKLGEDTGRLLSCIRDVGVFANIINK